MIFSSFYVESRKIKTIVFF